MTNVHDGDVFTGWLNKNKIIIHISNICKFNVIIVYTLASCSTCLYYNVHVGYSFAEWLN